MSRVFLSYGHDKYVRLAVRLKQDLEEKGFSTWFDQDRLKPGGDWEHYIEEGLEWASEIPGEGRFVLLMTPHSVRRPDGYCLNELARAIERDLPIIPVMVVWAQPPLSINRRQWVDMRDAVEASGDVYREKFEHLCQALIKDNLNFGAVQKRLIRRLEPISFEADIQEHLPHFTGRRWVARDLDAWLRDSTAPRIFWITGGPGMGKTALAAWLTTQRPELAAVHFCQHGNARKTGARHAATSLAYQLSTLLPDYQQRLNSLPLERILAEQDARTVFDELITQPLTGLTLEVPRVLVILVDGLDEATRDGQNELARILTAELPKTPAWLRLLVTSRHDEPEVALPLQGYEPYSLEAGPNAKDIRDYLTQSLAAHATDQALEEAVEHVLDRGESFLYARWVSLELAAGHMNLDDPDPFPRRLGAIYHSFFVRQFPDLDGYKKQQRPVLEAVCAAQEPLPLGELADMRGWSDDERAEVIESFGSLLAIREGAVYPFHLTALEWVKDRAKAGRYSASTSDGHRCLAEYAWGQYEIHPDSMPEYAVSHGVEHLIEIGRIDDACTLLTDYRFLRHRVRSGLQSLTVDFRRLTEADLDREQARALDAVSSALDLSFEILLREPDQLASQLQARLLDHDHPAVLRLTKQALSERSKPFLRAINPAVRQAGHPLIRALRSGSASDLFLSFVALDDANELAIASGEIGIVLMWNLNSGRLERSESLSKRGFSCGALDRGRLFLGGWDGSVTVLELRSGAVTRTGALPQGSIRDLAVSPDGRRLCTTHPDCTYGLRLWRLSESGVTPQIEIEVPGPVNAIAFTPDGEGLAVSVNKEVRMYQVNDCTTFSKLVSFDQDVSGVSFSPNQSTLAVRLRNGNIELLRPHRPSAVRTLGGRALFAETTVFQFLPDNQTLVLGGTDGVLRFWDTVDEAEVAAYRTGSKIFSLDIEATGRRALTGHKTAGARLWDLARIAQVNDTAGHTGSVYHVFGCENLGLAVSGGRDVGLGSYAGGGFDARSKRDPFGLADLFANVSRGRETGGASIRVWRMADGALLDWMPVDGPELSLSPSPEEGQFQILDDRGVSSWKLSRVQDIDGGEHIKLLRHPTLLQPQPTEIFSMRMTTNAAVDVMRVEGKKQVIIWRHPEWKAERIRQLRSLSPASYGFSANGQKCAMVQHSAHPLWVYDLHTGKRKNIRIVDHIAGEPRALGMAHSGNWAAVGTSIGAVVLVDLEARTVNALRSADGEHINLLAFSRDDTRLMACTSSHCLELWDVHERAFLASFYGDNSWSACWASKQAEWLIAGDELGGVQLLKYVGK